MLRQILSLLLFNKPPPLPRPPSTHTLSLPLSHIITHAVPSPFPLPPFCTCLYNPNFKYSSSSSSFIQLPRYSCLNPFFPSFLDPLFTPSLSLFLNPLFTPSLSLFLNPLFTPSPPLSLTPSSLPLSLTPSSLPLSLTPSFLDPLPPLPPPPHPPPDTMIRGRQQKRIWKDALHRNRKGW